MAQTLTLDNYLPLNLLEATQLDADSIVGATTLTVRNNQDYSVNDKILIGAVGTENCELAIVSAVTGNASLTIGATKFPHKRFDQVTKTFGDKAKIYTAPNVSGLAPADSAFTTLLTTLTLDTDNFYTQYTDSGGSSSFWYKYTYFNSQSSAETAIANSLAVRGGNIGNYCSIDDIRDEAGLRNNPYITDVMIDLRRRDAQGEIDASLSGLYTTPFVAPINALISKVTRLLSAGFIMTKNFGPMVALNTDNGTSKIKEARDILTQLNTKNLVLTDTAGNDISVQSSDSGIFTGYPNNSTATDDPSVGGGERMFRVSDISGNGGSY